MYSPADRAPAPAALEDPFYYLVNFQHVLGWVSARYDDLLSPAERDFIGTFSTLPKTSQALLVRMVMRKGTLFRAEKLRYGEIGPASEAVGPLAERCWVDTAPALSLEELFGLLTKTEVVRLFRSHISRAGARKDEILAALGPVFPDPQPLREWWDNPPGPVFALRIMEMCDRFRLMFFGNLRQDWSEFVLADLGLYRFETVEFSLASRAFQSRDEVDQYLYLYRCRERFEEYLTEPVEREGSLGALLADIPACASDNPWIEARRARLLYQIAYHCERNGEPERARALYAGCSHPDARVRHIRVLERSSAFQDALDLALEAEQLPQSEAEKQQVARILPRLRRKLGLPRQAARLHSGLAEFERVDLVLPKPAGAISVEQAVLEHLSEPRSEVWYVENTLINSLFGLLCWDVIFAPVPGAFFHRFHSGPADLLRPDFFERRRPLFEDCLAQLESDAYKNAIRQNFARKHGLQSPFVGWDGLSETLLEQALECFPRVHLQASFRRLLADIKANRAGLPDLIRFWPETGHYLMIEVKGPGDRLQDNQLRWLEFCGRHGMPVQVCYVQWQDEPDLHQRTLGENSGTGS